MNSRRSHSTAPRGLGRLMGGLLLVLVLGSCSGRVLKIQDAFVPPGSLRLAQVTTVGTRAEIVQIKELYQALISSGISDSEIVDGSVAFARVYCCGGVTKELSSENVNSIMIYIPNGMGAGPGDIVELRVADMQKGGRADSLNVATRVIQKRGSSDGDCWWDPKDDRLWLRTIYCRWMQGEGWLKQEGVHPAWFKPLAPKRTQE